MKLMEQAISDELAQNAQSHVQANDIRTREHTDCIYLRSTCVISIACG